MYFEWDNEKNNSNIQKHGISFEEASVIFERPVLDEIDNRFYYGETRERSIGELSNGICLFVVYTERDEDTIRIISARRADSIETERYYEYIQRTAG